jgi:hypothetical protein
MQPASQRFKARVAPQTRKQHVCLEKHEPWIALLGGTI